MNSRCNFADEIQLLCSQVVTSNFVQAVFIIKGHTPSVVMYSDEQVKDLKRFCSSIVADNMRSVLCVDRTFNLSSLFVTVTVFKLGMYRIVNFTIRPEPDSTGW